MSSPHAGQNVQSPQKKRQKCELKGEDLAAPQENTQSESGTLDKVVSAVFEALENDVQQIKGSPVQKRKQRECQFCSRLAVYRCPRCDWLSCGLECVKRHKAEKNCSGVRDRTSFVAMSAYSDVTLESDFRFLTETSDFCQSAHKNLHSQRPANRITPKASLLQKGAKKRSTVLKLMPIGLGRSRANQSYYDVRNDRLSWTVQWHFYNTDCVLKNNSVSEDVTLREILANHLASESGGRAAQTASLKAYGDEELDRLLVYLTTESCAKRRGGLAYVPLSATLRQALENQSIAEFPVFHVVLAHDKIPFLDRYGLSVNETEENQSNVQKECRPDPIAADKRGD